MNQEGEARLRWLPIKELVEVSQDPWFQRGPNGERLALTTLARLLDRGMTSGYFAVCEIGRRLEAKEVDQETVDSLRREVREKKDAV